MKVKFLSQEECDEILALSKTGMLQVDIAKKVGRSAGAVSHVINSARKGIELTFHKPNVDERPRFKEMDLASLPDNIIFHHTHYAIP